MGLLSVFVLIFSYILHPGSTVPDWQLHTEDDGIKVYTRIQQNERFKEVRIKLEIQAPIDKVRKVLNDVPSYSNWVYKCINPKRLETISSRAFYYYVETDMPFPISNRDLIVFSQMEEDQDTQGIISNSVGVSDYIPEKEDIVRIPFFQSQWKIFPIENGKLAIDYQVKTDPGGNIPPWLINWAVTIGPMQTMKDFRATVEQ